MVQKTPGAAPKSYAFSLASPLWSVFLAMAQYRPPHPWISNVLQTDFGVKPLMILLKVVKRWPLKEPVRTTVFPNAHLLYGDLETRCFVHLSARQIRVSGSQLRCKEF